MARKRPDDAADRVRNLILLDAKNVMQRLDERRGDMVSLFSRLRDRGPLVGTIHSWFQGAGFSDLSVLPPVEQRAASDFFELLGRLRWYFQYTEDMPLQLQSRFEAFLDDLTASHQQLMVAFGGWPVKPRPPRPKPRLK